MPETVYVGTTPSGHRQFVLRRARSHSHHHEPGEARTYITRDEMEQYQERERALRHNNDLLLRENSSLKANWQAADYEYRRLAIQVPQLQEQIRLVQHENRGLRRALEEHQAQNAAERLKELRAKYTHQKNENETLRQTIRHLRTELQEAVDHRVRKLRDAVDHLKAQVADWQHKAENSQRSCDDLSNRNERLRRALDMANDRSSVLEGDNVTLRSDLDRLERILRRHHLFP